MKKFKFPIKNLTKKIQKKINQKPKTPPHSSGPSRRPRPSSPACTCPACPPRPPCFGFFASGMGGGGIFNFGGKFYLVKVF
mgnify:CR=1 FL=1